MLPGDGFGWGYTGSLEDASSLFDYQNEAGRIPFYISDISISGLAACSPLHGAALDYILNV